MALVRYLSPKQLAEVLGVPLPTIYKWQHEGTAPPSIRVGKHTRYPEPGVESWLAARAIEPRSTSGDAA